uniref:Uncharacterized protein n=1 Tax=Oryza punctata TaxID=4537 RepID=A0A0E0M3H8_ORYPU
MGSIDKEYYDTNQSYPNIPLTTIYSNIPPQSKREQREYLDWRKPTRVLNTDDSPLCHVDVAKAKGAREPWSMKPASWTNVREDALKTKIVTRSRQSLRKMTPKSRCSRTMKEEMSR